MGKKTSSRNNKVLIHTLELLRTADAPALVEWLAGGVDINAQNWMSRTALHFAVTERRAEHVLALLTAGADPNSRDHWGYTPLHEAVFWGDAIIVEQLLAAGADPALAVTRGTHAGATALTIAKQWRRLAARDLLRARAAPAGPLPAKNLAIRGESAALDRSASKTPRKARADFRARYTVPLAASDKRGAKTQRGYGLPLSEYRVPLSDYSLRSIGQGTIPRCNCCGSRDGIAIYIGSGVSGNAPVRQNIIWRCELYCYECSWYSYWDFET